MDKMEVGKKYKYKNTPNSSIYECLGVFQNRHCWMVREGSASPRTYSNSIFKPYEEPIYFNHWYEGIEDEDDKIIPLMVEGDKLFYKYTALGKWCHAIMNVSRFLETFKHIGSIG